MHVANEGFGRNALATTPFTQYIIYLNQRHLNDNQADLADKIEAAWEDFVIDEFLQVTYVKGIRHNVELWCFVHLKKDDLNLRN